MLPELKTIEAQLKQVLYSCVEYVQATKAALYLSSSHDLNEKTYEIVTSYQFNPADRKIISGNDELIDRLTVKRDPFYVNGLGADQRFAEMMFRQGTDRMLASPLFSRGRLVGFIDMRDKAGKKPFDYPDIDAARTIAEEMIGVLARNKLFGLAPIAIVQDAPRGSAMPGPAEEAARTDTPGATEPGQVFSVEARKVIETARAHLSRRQHTQNTGSRHVVTDDDLDAVRLLLPAALAIPGAVLVCFTAVGHINNPQHIVALSTVTDAVMDKLQIHLDDWLQRTHHVRPMLRPTVTYPFATKMAPLTTLGPTFSAPVTVHSIEGLVLTFSFEHAPDVAAQRGLKRFLRQVEQAIESAVSGMSTRKEREILAEYLLEPDFKKFPELVEHCREVAMIAQRLARVLELPPAQIESIRLAALVHDVGLRLLDYERLYRRLNLTPEEHRGLNEHPAVGAALIEPLLGYEVAQAVLRHHERFDGTGYPSRLSGAQIPLASRIIQIADAWVAMTARNSYQVPTSREEAVERLREGAGTQFDASMVEKFVAALSEIA